MAASLAAAAIGGAASGIAGGMSGGSSKGGGTQSYWEGLAPWTRDLIKERAEEPLNDLRNQWIGQFKAQSGKTFPAMRKSLNQNYALRGIERSGFFADAMRKSYEQQAGAQMDFTASLPEMLNRERNNRIAMATGPAQQLPQTQSQNPWAMGVSGAANGINQYYQNQGFRQSFNQPASISQSYYNPPPQQGPLANPMSTYKPNKYFSTY